MIEIKAPNIISKDYFSKKKIFTAGSINMGSAIDWQKEFISRLKDTDFVVLNPRRDDWDNTWEQKITNRKFFEQVSWELNGLEEADYVFFYFSSEGISPISLLELGFISGRANFYNQKFIVCCEDKYFRKGNVDIVTRRYHGKTVKNLDEAVNYFINLEKEGC